MEKNTKIYHINGKYMQFCSVSFNHLFTEICKKNKLKKADYEAELGDILSVSSNAVHNWRFGMNGPSDVETITQLANYLKIEDFMLLLKDGKEKTTMKISERQKDSLKRIYDSVIEYLDTFYQTDGFNDYWHQLANNGTKKNQIEDLLYDIAEKEVHKVELALAKEYIELHRLPVYGELEEYISDILYETFNGKLSYAYRFEAPVENIDGTRDGVTTSEDFTRALIKINNLLENYM